MENVVRRLIRALPFIGFRVLLASSIGVFTLGISFAHAEMLATATIFDSALASAYPLAYPAISTPSIGPVTEPLLNYAAADSEAGGYVTPDGTVISGAGIANVTASVLFTSSLKVPSAILSVLSSTSPIYVFGTVEVEAQAEALGYGTASSSGSGILVAPFTLGETATPPFFLPQGIPVYLDVTGAAESILGSGGVYLSASVPGVTITVSHIPGSSSLTFASLVTPLNVDLGPGDSVPYSASADLNLFPSSTPYTVVIEADAAAVANGPYSGAIPLLYPSSDITAMIDPLIAFDQSSFDALYGPAAYTLSDYFAIVPASNLPPPIPEPATMLLLGSGLIGLAGLWRKKFLKK